MNRKYFSDWKPTWIFVLLYYWRYKIETKSKEWALTKDVKWSEQLLMCPLLFYMRPKVFRQSVRNIIYEKDKKGKLRMRTIYSTQYQRKKRPREINLLVFVFIHIPICKACCVGKQKLKIRMIAVCRWREYRYWEIKCR